MFCSKKVILGESKKEVFNSIKSVMQKVWCEA